MKFKSLFFVLITLATIIGCDDCEDCENLYHEPSVKLVFVPDSGITDTAEFKVDIKSINGVSKIDSAYKGNLLNAKRATYNLPLKVAGDPYNKEEVVTAAFNIVYDVMDADTVDVMVKGKIEKQISFKPLAGAQGKTKKFTLEYTLNPYNYKDRFLFFANVQKVVADPTVTCVNCPSTTAIIHLK